MFGLFTSKKEAAGETAEIIKNELAELRAGLASDAEKISSQAVSAVSSSFAERLSLLNISMGERLCLINSIFAKNVSSLRASIDAAMEERFLSMTGTIENKLSLMSASVNDRLASVQAVIEERFSVGVPEEGTELTESSLRESLSLMGGALDQKLSELEEQLQQSLRQERRRQMALESIMENQNRTIETLERKEIQEIQEKSPHLEAMMSLAENAALTRLANPESLEIEILYNKLTDLMSCFSLTLIADTGADFDPEKHEACGARRELERQDNSVLEIVRPGFLLRGKLLRCATVIVNRHDLGYGDSADGAENVQ